MAEKCGFYNIYPQSFKDSDGDGIGDLNGICEKLDYIQYMGFNAIWLNPIYESPFGDAGYDVSDFYKVAPRYGTNDDFKRLASEAKKRGIKVILDLVAGHTSSECEWFKKSALPDKNEYTDRYIWTDNVWTGGRNLHGGYSDRDGRFLSNFFDFQPALNYGYKNVEQTWQLPMNHPECLKTREELINIMRFWAGLGADGFRVDMANSLVKNDPTGEGTIELWKDIRSKLSKEFPEMVLISEWCCPKDAIAAGFDIDFLIHFGLKAYTTLFRYEKGTNQGNGWIGKSYFRREGAGGVSEFLSEYMEHFNATKGKGYISIPTGNHDMQRISLGRDETELKTAYTFIMTMPGVPFVYYGDEIGMKYIKNLTSKEGGYNRTGSRTPMQWSAGKNLGFSEGDTTYLPVDDDPNAPTAEKQYADRDSLLNHTRQLIKIRKENRALWADGDFEVICEGYPFIYKRSYGNDVIYVALNPSDRRIEVPAPKCSEIILNSGMDFNGTSLIANGVSYIIYK